VTKNCVLYWDQQTFRKIREISADLMNLSQNCVRCQLEIQQRFALNWLRMSKQKQKNNLCTQHVLSMFWAYNFHEQSVIILWVSWCKNKSFWQRFICTKRFIWVRIRIIYAAYVHLHIPNSLQKIVSIQKVLFFFEQQESILKTRSNFI
jgi:hypothetical protein